MSAEFNADVGLRNWSAPPNAPVLANVAIDTGLGTIPVVGDIFDIFFKSNLKNIDLLHDFIHKK